jgi:hypothetical protein
MNSWIDYPDSDHLLDLETSLYTDQDDYYLDDSDKVEPLMTNRPTFQSKDPFVSKTENLDTAVTATATPAASECLLLILIWMIFIVILAELYIQDQKIKYLMSSHLRDGSVPRLF